MNQQHPRRGWQVLHSEHPITERTLPSHRHWVTGVMHTQSQIHTLHTNTHHAYKNKGNRYKHKKAPRIACGIDTFLPDIPASLCQGGGLQLEGHYGWQWVEGKSWGGWTEDRITNVACHMVKQSGFTTDRVPHRQHGVGDSECQVWEWDQTPALVYTPFLASAACVTGRRQFGVKYVVFYCLVF